MENKNTEVSKDTINGMDYSFNVLWADDGGYVIDETCDNELCRAVITKMGLILISVVTGEAVLVEVPDGLRMATMNECISEGVMFNPPKYILH